MRSICTGLLAVVFAAAPAARADDVYLVHGESFEGVAAEVVGSQVLIRMAGGEMRLPRSLVARIEEAESPYGRFLERKRRLQADAEAPAAEWLELAEWAYRQGLKSSAREAARIAADRDPELAPLAPLMSRLGYARDAASGLWVRRSQAASRVASAAPQAAATTPSERELRRTLTAEIRQAAAEARQRETEIAEVRREAIEEVRQTLREARRDPAVGGFTGAVAYSVPAPVFVLHGGMFPPPDPTAPRPPHRGPVLDLIERQPGSLIPGHLSLGSTRP